MGINWLWMSPPHPQTEFMPAANNHGYWPVTHDEVDDSQGGWSAYQQLLTEASKRHILVGVDAVLNHFGPTDRVKIGGRWVDTSDTRYFRPPQPDSKADKPSKREEELWELLDTETDPEKLMAYQRELASIPAYGLPSLRHENPEVREYLIRSYQKFIDAGARMFRIDAAKHYPLDFQEEFANRLSAHARSRGASVGFIWEFLFGHSDQMALFASSVLSRLDDKSRALFLDFPLAFEVRRLQEPEYRFSWLWNFLSHRQNAKHPLKHYVPMVENHDNAHPIRSPFISKLIYALSEYVSENSVILHHGGEEAGALTDGRMRVEEINGAGNLNGMLQRLNQVLLDYRVGTEYPELGQRVANNDILFLERKLPGRSLFFFANKGNGEWWHDMQFPGKVTRVTEISRGGSNRRQFSEGGDSIRITAAPHSFVVFEVEYR
jgi:hypothetical protein